MLKMLIYTVTTLLLPFVVHSESVEDCNCRTTHVADVLVLGAGMAGCKV